MIINKKFRIEINNVIKTSSAKEKLYNFIDDLKQGIHVNESSFKKAIQNYKFQGNESYKAYNFESSIKIEIVDKISNAIKEKNNSEFVAYFDKSLVESYVQQFLFCETINYCDEYPIIENKLIDRIGAERFSEWKSINGPEIVVSTVSDLINDAVQTYDTHRYSDEMLQCVVEALGATSFTNALSDCQYKHAVGADNTNTVSEF